MYLIRQIIILAIGLSSVCNSFAQQDDLIPLDPTTRHGKLANGLSYFLKQNNTPTDHIFLKLVVKAGLRHEDKDQLGLAHLLEHVAFNGTKNYPNGALMEYFNTLGLVPGNNWNASTADYYTDYFINIPSNNKEAYNNCLQILRDWAQDMQLDPKEIDDERGVVLGEVRGGSSPLSRMEDNATRKQLSGHPMYELDFYERHNENIKSFKHESIIRYYNDWYRPDLEAIIIVGNINVDETEQQIKELFASQTMPENPRNPENQLSRYAVQLSGKGHFVAMAHKERETTVVKILNKKKKTINYTKSINDLRQLIIGRLFEAMCRQRFELLTQTDNKLFESFHTAVYQDLFGYYTSVDALQTRIEITPEQSIEESIKAVAAEFNRMATKGFKLVELNKFKEKVLEEYKNESKLYRANESRAARYQEYFLRGTAAPDPEKEFELQQKLIKEISLDEINAYAKFWIDDDQNIDIVILSPAQAKIPAENQVRKWIKEGLMIRLPEFFQQEEVAGVFVQESDLPVVDKRTVIKSITKQADLAMKEIQLNNGIKLLFKQQQFEGANADKIYITGTRPGGASLYSKSDYFNATATSLLGAYSSGIGKFNKYQMQKYLNERDINMSLYIDRDASNISGSCKYVDIEALFQLLYAQMISPKKDERVFDNWKEESKKANRHYFSLFMDTVQKLTYKDGNAENQKPKPKDWDNISLERIYEIHQNEFSNLENFTILINGNFNEDKMMDMFVKYFGGFKSDGKKIETIKTDIKDLAYDINKTFYWNHKEGAEVRLMFPARYSPSVRNDVMHEILGEAFKIVIRDRLREKEGGSYSPLTNVFSGKRYGNNYFYSVGFECAADNVERMIAAAADEVNKLSNNGLDEETFKKAKQAVKENLSKELKNVNFWPYHIKNQCLGYEDSDDILKTIGLYEIITAEEVSNAAKEYFTTENMMRFVMMPKK